MCGRLLEAIAVKIILRSRLSKIVSFADYLEGSGYLDSGWKGSGFLDYWSFITLRQFCSVFTILFSASTPAQSELQPPVTQKVSFYQLLMWRILVAACLAHI